LNVLSLQGFCKTRVILKVEFLYGSAVVAVWSSLMLSHSREVPIPVDTRFPGTLEIGNSRLLSHSFATVPQGQSDPT
jgi:hypothetical protein